MLDTVRACRFQIDSDIESDTSVFDVKSSTRENGRRSSTSTNNNNALPGDASSTPGSPPKAVRSNSESQNTPEKKCVTTMSGNNIAWYYQNLRFEFRSSLKNLWDSAQRFYWGFSPTGDDLRFKTQIQEISPSAIEDREARSTHPYNNTHIYVCNEILNIDTHPADSRRLIYTENSERT